MSIINYLKMPTNTNGIGDNLIQYKINERILRYTLLFHMLFSHLLHPYHIVIFTNIYSFVLQYFILKIELRMFLPFINTTNLSRYDNSYPHI